MKTISTGIYNMPLSYKIPNPPICEQTYVLDSIQVP